MAGSGLSTQHLKDILTVRYYPTALSIEQITCKTSANIPQCQLFVQYKTGFVVIRKVGNHFFFTCTYTQFVTLSLQTLQSFLFVSRYKILHWTINLLLDALMCSYCCIFLLVFCILTRPAGSSKYSTTSKNIQRYTFSLHKAPGITEILKLHHHNKVAMFMQGGAQSTYVYIKYQFSIFSLQYFRMELLHVEKVSVLLIILILK